MQKEKKKQPHPQSNALPGDYYYSNQHHQEGGWYNSSAEHVVQPPTPPGMRQSRHGQHPSEPRASPHMSWQPSPPPFHMSSGDMNTNSGGFPSSNGSVRPPSHPSSALGLTLSSFSYEELEAATGGFSRNHIIGQGGFGYVFKGVLSNGKEIAVKCLKSGSGQGDREFQAEVEIISRVHHRHLVSLEGYCIAGDQRILVYEFIPNSTLEHHLHGKDRPTMDWPTRLKIALGSAKGLAYLHEDCHPRIIHRDIKGANILLDNSFEAKVADFGLAKLTSDNYTHVSTRVMGTFGQRKLTEKSDTFSFGVMLLELVTGRRPVDVTGELMEDSLVDWARPLIDSALQTGNFRELADRRLEGNFDHQEMAQMVACAGACTRHSARRRPKMSQVVRALEGETTLDDLNTWNNKQTANAAAGYSSGNSSEYDRRKVGKVTPDSQGYSSSENGDTSDYGLHPSPSSASSHSVNS
ncbi:hypothetical protein SAY86_023199 [Trapa natans]|uniref:non-specific serine/threonine protein kinase n=1 Tax=Trapa natans TaxID=22666 RepID=A0AAN7LWV7_TRANT|nr:hypothetical protein SAY86_023199 [Trapa natans]